MDIINAVIFENNKHYITSIQHIFEAFKGVRNTEIKLVGEFSGDFDINIKSRIENRQPDIVLMDIGLYDGDKGTKGIELVAEIRKHFPNQKIVMLTGLDDLKLIKQAVDAGAIGYLTKDPSITNPKVLFEYIIDVVKDGKRMVIAPIPGDAIKKVRNVYKLTHRELEICEAYANDARADKIIESLNIDIQTVYSHVKNIKLKIELETMPGIIAKLLREGIIK